MGIFEYSISTDAIIGAIISFILLVFLVVNAIYWSNIVNEFNTNQLKATTATISKSTAQFLMIASIIMAVVVALYMLYNFGRWWYNSARSVVIKEAAAKAAVSIRAKASEAAAATRAAASTVSQKVQKFMAPKPKEHKEIQQPPPVKELPPKKDENMDFTIKKDCVKVTDCSKCQVKFNKDNLSFVSDNPTAFSKGEDEDTYQQKVPKAGNYYDIAQRTYLNTDNKNTTKFTLEKQLDSRDEPVRIIANLGGTTPAQPLANIFSKAPLDNPPPTQTSPAYNSSATQKSSAVPASQPSRVPASQPPAVPAPQPSRVPARQPPAVPAPQPSTVSSSQASAVPSSQPTATTEQAPATTQQKPGMFNSNSPTDVDRQREQIARTRPASLVVPNDLKQALEAKRALDPDLVNGAKQIRIHTVSRSPTTS